MRSKQVRNCRLKRSWPTKSKARKAARLARGGRNRTKVLRPYKCPLCEQYHLTSQPAGPPPAYDPFKDLTCRQAGRFKRPLDEEVESGAVFLCRRCGFWHFRARLP